ncbi:hypothetical protein [Bacteroides sedimenti]|uniref:DUF4468 domain-containing protein n=1 Tax=Bacteroides sedimenti TaxID=2136147 RepID=A0ABM8IC98_9BACE
MKKIAMFILFFSLLNCLKADTFDKYIYKKKSVPLLECKNNALHDLIIDMFEAEKKCDYYSDTLMMSVRIMSDSFYFPNESSDKYVLKFETGASSSCFVSLDPKGCFYVNKHICFVYGEIPPALFNVTKSKLSLFYRIPTFRKLKKGEIPQIVEEMAIIDMFSQWLYSFENSNFKLMEMFPMCTK